MCLLSPSAKMETTGVIVGQHVPGVLLQALKIVQQPLVCMSVNVLLTTSKNGNAKGANMLLTARDPFDRKGWNEFLNQFDFLVINDLTIEDVRRVLQDDKEKNEELRKKIEKSKQEWESKMLKCPQCSALMQLLPLNDSPATQTGDGSHSMWLCRRCFYEQFSDKTVSEEMQNFASLQPTKTGE